MTEIIGIKTNGVNKSIGNMFNEELLEFITSPNKALIAYGDIPN